MTTSPFEEMVKDVAVPLNFKPSPLDGIEETRVVSSSAVHFLHDH